MNSRGVLDASDRLHAAAGARVRRLLAAVEAGLSEVGAGTPLRAPAAATISAGGKRLRPMLLMLAASPEAPADAEDALVRAGVAVELVHSATLVHDDVLDAALLRRGHPTVVASAGRAAAVATGDLMFSRAFAELTGNGDTRQLGVLTAACAALARGELIQREDAWRVVDEQRYLERCELKTASLFEAACRLGVLAGPTPGDPEISARADRLGRFGRYLGVAFQMLDDVLDVAGPAQRTGKQPGTDLLDGTVTLPLIIARRRAASLADLDPAAIIDAESAAEVCRQIAGTGALEETRDRAWTLVRQAKEQLHSQVPPGQREMLELVADGVVERFA